MAILSKGTDFSTGDQVTAANLDALVDSATFAAGAVDNTTTALDSSSPQRIIVKNLGVGTNQLANSESTTTGVTFAKMQHVAANTVLVRDSNAEGDISAKAVVDKQILIGNGNGFTPAILSGDATMANTGAVTIKDDVALGGNPTTTTQAAGNNTTRIATTAFVTTAIAVDDSTTELDSSTPKKIIVKGGGITATQLATDAVETAKILNSNSTSTGVTFAKMQHVPANTVLVRDSSSEGNISAKAVTDTQILIGDGTGFTAAALSGDATMTNAGVVDISDDVALGGNPTTTTQSAGNNTTRVATTAFVTTAVANVNVTPNNRLLIKVLPSSFGSTTNHTVQAPTSGSKNACIEIPSGYKATQITAFGNCNVRIDEGNIGSETITEKSTTTGISESGTLINFTDITSSATNYLIVRISKGTATSATNFNGGSITLVAV